MQALRAKVALGLEAPPLGSSTLLPCDRGQNPSSAGAPLPVSLGDNPLPGRAGAALDLEWRGLCWQLPPGSSVSPDKSIYA